ncbi:MAG TPA: oligosaccharide flippase family protein [Candidatus Cybelea sp.]|nr:oligosaccharide flippase family protein [Candidatus Cybelea sp.]
MGNSLSAGMGFLILAFLARTLKPSEFGTLSPIVAVLDTGQLLIDSVLTLGMLHVASKYAVQAPQVSNMALKIGLWTRLAVGLAIGLVGVIASRWISVFLLETPDWSGEIMLMFVAIAPISTYTFVTFVLQTRERFVTLAIVSLCKNGFRLVLIGGIFLLGLLSVTSVVWSYAAAAIAAAAFGLFFVRAGPFLTPGIDRSILKEIFSVNKWMVLAAIGILGARIDILMLTRISTSVQVAWYTAAFQLCMVFGILSQALVTTLFPRTSKLSSAQEVRRHVLTCLKYAPFVLAAGAAVTLVSPWIVPLLLGKAYAATTGVFNILLFSSLVTLLMNPILLVFFPMNWSSMFGMASLLQLLLRIALNLLLIAPYGAMGAGVADLASKILITAGMLCAVAWRMRRMEREGIAGGTVAG